jgi:peptide-methionine (S)-S-oxide reductase
MNTRLTSAPVWAQTIQRLLGCLTLTLCALGSMLGSAFAEGQTSPLPDATIGATLAAKPGKQTAVFAGGCFWGVEAVFLHVKGVLSSTSGYAGGSAATASYPTVSGGNTGHAEAVEVVFDPAVISYGQLLKIFFSVAHDPTQLNRQGPDHGTHYRSAIFTTSPEQQRVAETYVKQLTAAKVFRQPIVTKIDPLPRFFPAEAYHQGYLARNMTQPYIVINDLPKLAALESSFPALYRKR